MKIDKNIPVPPVTVAQQKYPWHQLEVGDSFFVPGRTPNKMRSSINHAQIRWARRFAARNVEGGVRIWRTG